MIKIALLFAAALLASTTPALADSDPSFDCVQASTPEEKLICSDDTLADLDRQLAASYAKLLEEHEDLRSFI